MLAIKKVLSYLTVCFLLTCTAIADSGSDDEPLLIAISSQFSPYTINHQARTGIDPALISKVLEETGYEVAFQPTPSRRMSTISLNDNVDGMTGWLNNFPPHCFQAKPYRYWYNALIVSGNSNISSIADLAGKRVAVYEGAEEFLEDYQQVATLAAQIIISDSSLQAGRMIKSGRVDAYIGDYIGYYYALKQQYGKKEAERLTSIKLQFKLNKQRICFKDKLIRDQFDAALDKLIDQNIYQTIYRRYSPDLIPPSFPTRDR